MGLLLWRCPEAVRGSITYIILTAFDPSSLRTRTHVGEKGGKRILPTRTNSNATSSVVLPVRGFRVAAAYLHGDPDSILAGAAPLMDTAKTSATSRLADGEIFAEHAAALSAIAEAAPHRVLIPRSMETNDQPSSEAPPGEFESPRHLRLGTGTLGPRGSFRLQTPRCIRHGFRLHVRSSGVL